MTPADIAAIRVVPNQYGPVLIGNRGYGGWNFDGDIDEVAIYGSALSAGDVLAHYQNGTSASPSQSYSSLVLAGARSFITAWMSRCFRRRHAGDAANLGSLGTTADGDV